MAEVKQEPSAALIGDIIGSRSARDRQRLHQRVDEVLEAINRGSVPDLVPSVPLRITVGDEFQGAFATVGAATLAALLIRVRLLPEVDVRHGIGWGPLVVLRAEPRVEDGPGWWAAREAIDRVKEQQAKAGGRSVRTLYQGPDQEAINAALICRDHMVGSMSERSLALLRGMLDDRTQAEVAEEIGISPSAASQRVRVDGIGVVVNATRMLGGVR